VFDNAEEGGTVLLFDEADALFVKRSEIKTQSRSLRQYRIQSFIVANGGVSEA